MNKKYLRLLLSVFILNTAAIHGGNFIGKIFKQIGPKTEGIAFGIVGKAEKQLAELKEEKKGLQEEKKQFTENINKKLAELVAEIRRITALIGKRPENQDFLSRKLDIVNETYQAVKDLQTLRAQLVSLLDEHIALLEGYLNDTDFKDYIKDYREQRRFYSFNDLQNLHETILSQEKRISSLREQLKNTQIELENREHTSEATNEEYRKTKTTIESFRKDPEKTVLEEYFEFDNDQKLDLLAFREELLKYKKRLHRFRLKEVQYKRKFLEDKLLIAELKIGIIKKTTKDIKTLVRITEADISKDKAEIENEKREAFVAQQRFRLRTIEPKTKEYEKIKTSLNKLSEQYKIPINIELNEWEVDPKTAHDYRTMLQIGKINESLLLLDSEKILLEAQMKQGEEQLYQKTLNVDAKETYYKIIARKFNTEEDINKEKRKYNSAKAVIKAKVASFKEKINARQDQIRIKNKALENIREIQEKLKSEQGALFRNNPMASRNCFNLLKTSQETIKKQIATMKGTISIYENIISMNDNTNKQVNFILSELETLGMFYRPEYAIKWEEAKNIIPDISRFGANLTSYILRFNMSSLVEKIKMAFPNLTDLLGFIAKLLLVLLILLFFRIYAPLVYAILLSITQRQENKGAKFATLLVVFILEFLMKYFVLISVWIVIFAAINLVIIPDYYISVLFHLFSIPYLLYITNRLLKHFALFNKRHNLLFFIEPNYQKRLLFLAGMVLYSTIAMQLFRKAFMLRMDFPSELPSVISALNRRPNPM